MRIKDLPTTTSVGTTDYLVVDQGTTPVTRRAQVSAFSTALVNSPSYSPLSTYPANSVGAELRVAQAQTEHFWRAVRANQRDVYIMVAGDSTGNEVTEWVYLMAQWLAAQCPTHTVKYRLFNDGSTAWDAYSTLQTGTGPGLPYTGTPFTIYVDNGSVTGTNTFYSQGGREYAFWGGNDYDLVFVNYGHNFGTASTEALAMPEWVVALSHFKLMAPRAGLLVTLQNPRSSTSSNINTNGSAQSARMVTAWRKAVDLAGAAVVDVYTAFLTSPNYAALMADETHPNAAGQQVWLQEVQRVMAEPIRYTGNAPLVFNPLAEQRPNFAPNPRFSSWTGSTPDNWSFTNCTATKELGVTNGGLYSLRITAGAGTNPAVTADVSTYLSMFAGRTVTFCARLWVPSGLALLAGRIEILSTDNVSSSTSFVSYPRGTPSQNGWQWAQATLTIPETHTQLTLRIYAGAADGSDSGKFIYVDSVWFGPGWMPSQASLETAPNKFVIDYYGASNVGKITGNNGTLTVVGSTITLAGSGSSNSDVYINLPGLTPGQSYTFTFTADSCTGNTAGGVYVRNGFNGGVSTITTGTWTVGLGSTTTFTAPNGPVSLWVYGYTGATGWQISSASVKAVSPTFLNIPVGNLLFSYTGQRVLGDFSNATHANRLMFQSSSANGNTIVGALPSGINTTSAWNTYNSSDPANASTGQFAALSTDIRLTAGAIGTGTQLPMKFYVNGLERMQIATNGYVAIGTAGVAPSAQLDLGAGNLAFTSTAQRITGDFSNATVANRLTLQSSTTNGNTNISAIPNGTGVNSSFNVFNNSDPNNASFGQLLVVGSTDVRLQSSLTGTGTYLPMTFYTGGSERVRIDTSGNVGIGTASPGYKLDVSGTFRATGLSNFDNAISLNTASLNYLYYTSALAFSQNGTGERMRIDSSGNVGIGVSAFGTSAAKVLGMANATAPTTSPAGMGQLYVEAGALKYRGSSGTVTTIAAA